MVVCPIYAYRLMGINPITVSLVALFRVALLSFLKGDSLPSNSCFATRKNRRQKLFDLQTENFLF
jgi:hypothetical protein